VSDKAYQLLAHGRYFDIVVWLCSTTLQSQFIMYLIRFLVFNATFSNISAISWRPVLVVQETGLAGEKYRPWASN
jgi:hypothetical protein